MDRIKSRMTVSAISQDLLDVLRSSFMKDIRKFKGQGRCLFVAGGVGAAPVYPQVKWLHEHGIEADVIVGSKDKRHVDSGR